MHDGGDGVEEGERVGPVSARIASASAPEVSGPVAMIQWPSGQLVDLALLDPDAGMGAQPRGHAFGEGSRSTASAPPAGSGARRPCR
jgi:hypothetical protein